MEYQISPPQWLQLSHETRQTIKSLFNVPRSQGTIVEGTVIRSDGHTFDDLAHITVGKMQEFLDSTEQDFMTLFNEVVKKIEQTASDSVVQEVKPDPRQLLVNNWIDTLSKLKNSATENSMEDYLDSAIKAVFDLKPIIKPEDNAKNKTKSTKATKQEGTRERS